MQQVKLFKSIETDIRELEREINTWLSQSGVKVVHMFGNISPQTTKGGASSPGLMQSSAGGGPRQFNASDVFLAVVYEKA